MKRHKVTSELPFVGMDDVSIVQDSVGEVHVFAHPEEEVVVHQENPKTGRVGESAIGFICIDDIWTHYSVLVSIIYIWCLGLC